MRTRLAMAVLAALPVVAGAQTTSPPVPLHEWPVPWKDSRPRDPVADKQGRVWFVGQAGNYVARLDPSTGQFHRFTIDPGAFPHTVNLDGKGNAWFTGNRNGSMYRIDAAGKISRYPVSDSTVRDPHTIAFAPNGDLWFTAQFSNAVTRMDPATGRMRVVKMPGKDWRPYGITTDSKGHPWFDLFGTNRIGTIDPATMQLRTFELPNDRARPRRIAVTSDDMVWYVDYVRGFIGRLDPKSGAVKEWQNPAGAASLPYAMTVDDQDRLWFVETGTKPNRLVGFDPKGEKFFGMTDIGGGDAPNTVRHMTFDRATGQIWFGTDLGTIGRATVGTKSKPIS
jgi:virginiamycin B lyase